MFTQTNETIENANRVSSFVKNGNQELAVFSICDVWDYFEVLQGLDILQMSWEEESKLIIDFCKKHNLYLYEKPKEDFFQYEAIHFAENNGYKGVVLSNLS